MDTNIKDGDKGKCKNCGRELEYHAGSLGWFHLPLMTYYCFPHPDDSTTASYAEPKIKV